MMTAKDLISPNNGQLSLLYLKWKDDPSRYGEEMVNTINSIIHYTLNKQSLEPIYRRTEDVEDLYQELRVLCFQKLDKITDPSNKRIFNYLRVSISLALKDRARRVGKKLDREAQEAEILGEKTKSFPTLFYYGDEMLEQVATLLANGETKQSICLNLKIKRTELDKQIDRLKVIYNDKK